MEQSRELTLLGLDPQTADQYYWAQQTFDGNEWVNTGVYFRDIRQDDEQEESDRLSGEEHFQYLLKTFGASRYDDDEQALFPCWSAGALLDVMPREIDGSAYSEDLIDTFNIKLEVTQAYYEIRYEAVNHPWYWLHSEIGDTLADVCVAMVKWLLENGHIARQGEAEV